MNESARRRGKHTPTVLSLPISIGYAFLVGFVCAIVLLFLSTAIVYAQADPNRFALPGALAVLYISSAVSGAIAVRLSGSPLLSGGFCGALWLVLILLMGLVSGGRISCGFSTLTSVLAHAAIPLTSLIGSFLGKKHPKRSSTHHKKRRR